MAPSGTVRAAPRAATPWHYRTLVWNFARRDLTARFRGTALGWAWSLLLPLATLAIYSLVFSVIIRVTPPPFGDGDAGLYAVWLFAGLVPWAFMNQFITRGTASLLANGPLLRKVYVPPFVPVVAIGLSIGIQSLLELGLLAALLAALGNVSWTWLLTPVWAVLLFLFTGGLVYMIATANVYWRDLAQLTGVVMQLLFFLSAIIYPISLVPAEMWGVPTWPFFTFNPFAQFADAGRELLYDLQVPSFGQVVFLVAATGLSLAGARWAHLRWGRDLNEAI